MQQRTVILARISTPRQDNARQVSDLKEAAQENGWTVVEVLEEVSSGNADLASRPALQRILAMAKAGEIDRVAVSEVSRLSRRPTTMHDFMDALESHKVSLYWHAQRVETLLPDGRRNPSAAIMLALLAEMARAERDTLIERINSGLRAAREKGVRLGRPPGWKRPARERHTKAAGDLEAGQTVEQVAAAHGLNVRTVWRIKASMRQ